MSSEAVRDLRKSMHITREAMREAGEAAAKIEQEVRSTAGAKRLRAVASSRPAPPPPEEPEGEYDDDEATDPEHPAPVEG